MIKKTIAGIVAGILALVTGMTASAQSYSNAVMALNPAGYWPLQETVQPPNGYYVATNLGTGGAAANGYYQTWYQPSGTGFFATNNILRTNGATGDGDLAMTCNRGTGQYVVFPRSTNGVPNPAVTIAGPFSIECWVNSGNTNLGLQPIITEGRNPVAYDPAVGSTNTFLGFSFGQFKNIFYWQVYNARINGNSGYPEVDSTIIQPNTWYHVVAIFDGNNIMMFLNGAQVGGTKAETPNYQGSNYVVDPISPLLIGTGTEISSLNGGVVYTGSIDDVAIYPVALSQAQISAHIAAASGTTYASTVEADQPTIYLRLDEPPMTTFPSTNQYPVAVNYGSVGAAANGAYQPGTSPGAAGPAFAGFGPGSTSVAFNGFYGGVDVGGGALPAAFNPTGTNQPFSVATWFQGNPADVPGRFQVMVGHTDRSWRLTMDGGAATSTAGNKFNPGNGPELGFASTADVVTNGFRFNDGNWHFAVGVFDGTNDYMYLDGSLAKTGTGVGSIVGTNLDMIIGGDPQYTVPLPATANVYRWFDGQLAHVAFFTNALTASNVQQLFAAAEVPPNISLEPPALFSTNANSTLTIAANARGSSPLSFQWYQNNVLAPGQTNASLIFNPVLTNSGGNYYLVASNGFGTATSSVVALTVFGPPTIIQQSLTDVQVFAGASPTLHVTVAGAPPLHYQWTSNSTAIANATNSSFTVANVQASAVFGCTITNFAGTALINPITVTALADPTAPFPVKVLSDAPIAYFRLDEASGTTAYDYVGGNNGVYTNATLGQPGYTSLDAIQSDPTETSVEFGDFPPNNNYAGNVPPYLNFGSPTNTSVAFSVEAWFNEFLFQNGGNGIVAIGTGNGGEQFVLDTGSGSAGAVRFFVRNSAGSTSTAGGSYVPKNDGKWHHMVGVCDEPNGKVSLYLDGVLAGSGTIATNSGILSSSTPLSIGARQSSSALPAVYDFQFIGRIDDVAVYNYALSGSQVSNHFTASGIAPVITQLLPSNSVTTNSGANVTFSVAATGTTPLSYQWFDNNGSAISSATNSALTLNNLQQSQGGNYQVTVSNLYGTETTNINLTVDLGPPQLVQDISPLAVTNFATTPLTYSVVVAGSAPFSYQWFQNNTAIPGATNASYSFGILPGTNTYFVSITNAFSFSQGGGPIFSSTGTVVGLAVPTLNPGDYSDRMKIIFSGYTRGETLAAFPALVNLGTNIPGFSYAHFASPSGGDLRFSVDTNGSRVLPSEIDQWNPNGVSTVWVQIPALSSTNDFIWAFWGNPGLTTPPASDTNGDVWLPPAFTGDEQYDIVYHLKESALPFFDSTLQAPATNGVAPTPTNGIVSTGESFDGTDFLSPGNFSLSNQFTVSVWVNTAGVNNIQTLWANKVGGFSSDGFGLYVNTFNLNDGALHLETGNGSSGVQANGNASAVSPGQWHLITTTLDRGAGQARFYVDATDVTSSSPISTDFNITNVLSLGHFNDGSFPYHGLMDEARIQNGTNSPNWIWASWMTVASNAVFETYSSLASSAVVLNIQTSGNQLILTWPQGTLQSASSVNGPYSNVTGATSPFTVSATGPAQFYRVKVH